MNWHSLSKHLKYVPRLIWMCCALGIIVILLQGRISREEHRKLSGQKEKSGMGVENIIIHEDDRGSMEESLSSVKEDLLLEGETGAEEILSAEVSSAVDEELIQEAAETEPAILPIYQELFNQNNDLAGWLAIEDTVIDYPVMQCDDNDFYLHHDFEKRESKYGELFVKAGCPLDGESINILIYGHHMKDGSMFGSLKKYEKQEYYEEHPYIRFDTLYEQFTYEIMAVFRSQVYEDSEDVFKYYQYYGELAEGDFLEFYQNIKDMSLYDTGVDAVYGDALLMLSTCAYHVKNGRFVIVAKRIP